MRGLVRCQEGSLVGRMLPIDASVGTGVESLGWGGVGVRVCGTLLRMSDETRFPEGFLFGAAVSAHQVEGGNTNNDWWWWEHIEGTLCREPSGDACDFYHRYAGDIALLASLGMNAFRFSIEWARIEPADGEFSNAQLVHY